MCMCRLFHLIVANTTGCHLYKLLNRKSVAILMLQMLTERRVEGRRVEEQRSTHVWRDANFDGGCWTTGRERGVERIRSPPMCVMGRKKKKGRESRGRRGHGEQAHAAAAAGPPWHRAGAQPGEAPAESAAVAQPSGRGSEEARRSDEQNLTSKQPGDECWERGAVRYAGTTGGGCGFG